MVSFDLETTGVNIETDRILTAAISFVSGGKATCSSTWLLNPGVPIPPEVTEVHGITNEKAALGDPPAEALEEIISILASALNHEMALVVYNARFDISMLDREAKRHNLIPLSERAKLKIVDPLILDKQMVEKRRGKRTLDLVCGHYNIPFDPDSAHDAAADALYSARLAFRICKRNLDKLDIPLEELHQKQIEWAKAQGEDLQRFFDEKGIPEKVKTDWPLLP